MNKIFSKLSYALGALLLAALVVGGASEGNYQAPETVAVPQTTPPTTTTTNTTTTSVAAKPTPEELYHDEWWADLPPEIQQAYVTLGYNEAIWNEGGVIAVEDIYWSDMTPEQQAAAAFIGYSQEQWDQESGKLELGLNVTMEVSLNGTHVAGSADMEEPYDAIIDEGMMDDPELGGSEKANATALDGYEDEPEVVVERSAPDEAMKDIAEDQGEEIATSQACAGRSVPSFALASVAYAALFNAWY